MRETFSQRIFLALSGDEAAAGEVPSAASEEGAGGGSFLPHLSLLGAIQSRQLGEFLDGKGVCRVVTSDKPQAVECALLARQQLISGGQLVRLSQLRKGLLRDDSLPRIQEDSELRVKSPRSKTLYRDFRSKATEETTSTRSPLTSQDGRDPSIIGEDETGVKPAKDAPGILSKTVHSIRQLYRQCTLDNTCGRHFSLCTDVLPGRTLSTGVFDAEAMKQVVTTVQREDLAVVCATWEELSCCLHALEGFKLLQEGEVAGATAEEGPRGFLSLPPHGLFRCLMTSCGIPYARSGSSPPPPAPLPPPGSVWEIQLKRDAETLKILDAEVTAQAKTNYLSRACTHMWEGKKPAKASASSAPPLSVQAVRERLQSDVAALAVSLTSAFMNKREELSSEAKASLSFACGNLCMQKTGHISKLLFLTLLGLGGEEAASEEQIATLFRLYGLSFGETVNYLEFISRVTDGCDVLDLGTFDLESFPSRVGELVPEKQKTVADRKLSRGWSCRENIQTVLSSMQLKAYSPSTASAAAVASPERVLLLKPDASTGEMKTEEIIKLLEAEGTGGALPEDVSAFLSEVPAAAGGLDSTLLSALQQFIRFRQNRFHEATNGLGWLHIDDAAGLFEDFTFEDLPLKLECRHFQRKIGASQLFYKQFLEFGEFVAKRRSEFRRQASVESSQEQVTFEQGVGLARLWGFAPSLSQAAAMQQHLSELRKQPQNERSLLNYEELLHLLSAVPHAEDQPEELALLFRHFDIQARYRKAAGESDPPSSSCLWRAAQRGRSGCLLQLEKGNK
ncbi:hypothetical protein Efla_007352 [Eimeria flavescens]